MSDDGRDNTVTEVRERTATLEAQTERLREDIKQVDAKQDEILAQIQSLNSNGLDEEEFENDYAPEIEKNTKVRYVLQLLGALTVAVSSGAVVAFL